MNLVNRKVRTHSRRDMGEIMVLPVNWRSTLSFDEGGYSDEPASGSENTFSLKDITPESITIGEKYHQRCYARYTVLPLSSSTEDHIRRDKRSQSDLQIMVQNNRSGSKREGTSPPGECAILRIICSYVSAISETSGNSQPEKLLWWSFNAIITSQLSETRI